MLICTNTMHKVVPQIQAQVDLPILHIADATAGVLLADGVRKTGLLGTRFTMEQDFYRERLISHGIEVVVPEESERQQVHRIIYDELCLGNINDDSRRQYLQIIERLQDRGCEAVILGCTEISLLVRPEDTQVPLYDTTAIHAQQAVDEALG